MPQGALLSCFFCPFRVALVILTCLVSFGLAQNEKILYNFEAFPRGATPMSNLIADAAGNLYGTTYFGGPYQGGLGVGLNGSGTVFELSSASEGKWTEKVLYRFTGGNDGANPAAGLVFDTAGNLYGVTGQTAFKLSPLPQGEWTESTIHTFTGYPNDGIGADGSLIFDNAGNLYGTTFRGGTYDSGIIFELSPGSGGSWTETILYNFSNGQDGANPAAGLIFDSAGDLYGTTEGGGDANCENEGCGVVFELSPNGNGTWTETVLHSFAYSDGAYPQGILVSDSAGNLYGTAQMGAGSGCGNTGCGVVFRLHPASGGWIYAIIYTFEGGLDGAYPMAGVVFHSSRLYGTTQAGGGSCSQYLCTSGTVFELTPYAEDKWTEKIIHSFSSPVAVTASDDGGSGPVASLIFDQRGNLYGTAENGGSYGGACTDSEARQQLYGCGAAFKLTPTPDGRWENTTLYRFPSVGAFAPGNLVYDGSGNLYGIAGGGRSHCYGAWGCGTVFGLERDKKSGVRPVVLHSFNGTDDGAAPVGPLIVDKSGNLYGATEYGGNTKCSNFYTYCGGTVFELSPSAHGWKETVLYKFRPPLPSEQLSDGQQVMAGLTMDSEGNLYGTTSRGGIFSDNNCVGYYGCGTVFKLSQSRDGEWKEELLYLFQGGLDGAIPYSTLIFDDRGALYGTTAFGGAHGNGTVFKLVPRSNGRWTEQILYNFQGSQSGDGRLAVGGLSGRRERQLLRYDFRGREPELLLPVRRLWRLWHSLRAFPRGIRNVEGNRAAGLPRHGRLESRQHAGTRRSRQLIRRGSLQWVLLSRWHYLRTVAGFKWLD